MASFIVGRSRLGGGDDLGGQTQPPAVNAASVHNYANIVKPFGPPASFRARQPAAIYNQHHHRSG